MTKQRFIHTEEIVIEECEVCKDSHVFQIELIFDREVDAHGLLETRTEMHDVVMICPNSGQDIRVSVPVNMDTQQTLVAIRPKV